MDTRRRPLEDISECHQATASHQIELSSPGEMEAMSETSQPIGSLSRPRLRGSCNRHQARQILLIIQFNNDRRNIADDEHFDNDPRHVSLARWGNDTSPGGTFEVAAMAL